MLRKLTLILKKQELTETLHLQTLNSNYKLSNWYFRNIVIYTKNTIIFFIYVGIETGYMKINNNEKIHIVHSVSIIIQNFDHYN